MTFSILSKGDKKKIILIKERRGGGGGVFDSDIFLNENKIKCRFKKIHRNDIFETLDCLNVHSLKIYYKTTIEPKIKKSGAKD